MSQTITVSGSMYEYNYIEISDEDLQRIVDAKDSDNDWEELEELADIHEELTGTPRISGFTPDEEIQVFVGSDEIKFESENTESEGSAEEVILKAHYLVFEMWSKFGSTELEIEDEFEPKKFGLSVEQDKLPNGKVRIVLNPFYSEGEFDFQSSDPTSTEMYILKSDGTRIDL